MTLNKKSRAIVREMFGGRCAYCGAPLGERWHADHVEAVIRISKWQPPTAERDGRFVFTGKMHQPANDRIENFFPACGPCNIDKGCMALEDWRGWLNERIVDGLRRNSSTFRHAERFGRVTINPEPLVFHFERYLRAEAAVSA
jgi:hypothetical protein